jgi:hypothetical protein
VLFPDRAIAEIETLLLEPDSSWIDDPPKTIGESELQKSCCFHGHSEAQPTTTSAITTPASEDFSDFRFLCCSPQVILLKNGGIPDGGHHLQETCLLMADLEGVF